MVTNLLFPTRHLSVRVPWHDAGWNGTVCQDPTHNVACLKLKSIADKKDDDALYAGTWCFHESTKHTEAIRASLSANQ